MLVKEWNTTFQYNNNFLEIPRLILLKLAILKRGS